MDTRYNKQAIVSHDSSQIDSIPVNNANDILAYTEQVDVVAVDEAQFFDDELVHILSCLAHSGIRVIVAGLDMDYKAQPFGPMPELLAHAEYITKLHAICVKCGDIANYSYRTVNTEERILLGEKESYEPRCRSCYNLDK